MYVIKRTKASPPGPDGKPAGRPAVHYAARVGALGDVDAWTADRDRALLLDDDRATQVLERYADRPLAGAVEAEEATWAYRQGVQPVPVPEPEPEPAPEPRRRGRRAGLTEIPAGTSPAAPQAEG